MGEPLNYGPVTDPLEWDRLREILTQCFAFPVARWQPYLDMVGVENFRAVRRADRVAGGLAVLWMGQFFGGRSVPMAGVAAVGVPPEERAGGVARSLMTSLLFEARERGFPLSVLYASTQHLYRAVGYEQAGFRFLYEMPADGLTLRDRSLPLEKVDPATHTIFHEIYTAVARESSGCLDRCRGIWLRTVYTDEADPVIAYRVGPPEQAEGYAIFTQSKTDHGYDLRIRDYAALTPAALRRILTLFADHRSLASRIHWAGSPAEPLLCLPEEQRARSAGIDRWMLRIVDVAQALEARGYPPGVDAELHLEIDDHLIPENRGRWVLDVGGGAGSVRQGGRGDIRTGIREMAPLYTGMLPPVELRRIGWLEGGDNALLEAARVFSGPTPWMTDPF